MYKDNAGFTVARLVVALPLVVLLICVWLIVELVEISYYEVKKRCS